MKSNESGFTLLELLVVVIIMGILAAISIPTYLNQSNRARLSEAQTYLSSWNRAQQAYFSANGEFADTFQNLEMGLPTTTESYNYALDASTPVSSVTFTATPTNPTIRGVSSRVYVQGNSTPSLICVGNPGQVIALGSSTECPN